MYDNVFDHVAVGTSVLTVVPCRVSARKKADAIWSNVMVEVMQLIPDLGKTYIDRDCRNIMVSNFAQTVQPVIKKDVLLCRRGDSVTGLLGSRFLRIGSGSCISLALQTERNLLAIRGMYSRDRHCCLGILTWSGESRRLALS